MISSAFYWPGWQGRARWANNRYFDPARKPLLGYYDENNPEVIDWQIKYWVENGIKCIAVDWYDVEGCQWLNHWLNAYRKARYRDMIKIAVLWCNHYPGTYTHDNFVNANKFLIDNIFTLPSYYKLTGKPAVFVFQSTVFRGDLGSAGIASAIAEVKAMAVNAGFGGITYVAGIDGDSANEAQQLVNEGYSGNTRYHGGFDGHTSWLGNQFNAALTDYPVVDTGWAPGPFYGGTMYEGRTPESFKNCLINVKNYIQAHPKPLIVLGPDGEWGEGSYISPSVRFGFNMLEKVREVYCTDPPTSWPLNYAPEDVGLGPRYEYPDPIPQPLWKFDAGTEGWSDFWLTDNMRAEAGQLRFHCTWNNPAICTDVPFIRRPVNTTRPSSR